MENPSDNRQALLVAYQELCKSYHAIDDFRMKLLGYLPLASLIGLFLLDTDQLPTQPGAISTDTELVGFAGIFASLLTLALFSYELRGIRRCHNLITEGEHLEQELGIGHGQFHVCAQEHQTRGNIKDALNAKFTACIIYSLVASAWLFVALRFGFGVQEFTCSVGAIVTGSVIASASFALVRGWTSA